MNLQLVGLAANASHRTDQALGIWTASGKGIRRVHSNFDGWELRTNTRRTWTIHRPGGERVDRREWPSLWVAKYEAGRLIAAAAETA